MSTYLSRSDAATVAQTACTDVDESPVPAAKRKRGRPRGPNWKPPGRRRGIIPRRIWIALGDGSAADYTPDELEFMFAVQSYKEKNQRPRPTDAEILTIARSLGYRKMS